MAVKAWLHRAAWAVAGLASVLAFYATSELHRGYPHPREGLFYVPSDELVYLLWHLVWNGLAVALLARVLYEAAGQRLLRLYEACQRHSPKLLIVLALPLLAGILVLRQEVLLGQPVADDELVYELNARNLALGRLTSTPPIDPEFLANQFVVVDAQHWHGKYPIGHSLLLAPFELIERVDLLGALLALATFALCHAVASHFVGTRGALLAAMLLAVSPHFLLTYATLLSQTSSTTLMLLAAYASLRDRDTGQRRWLWLMGAAMGFGILVRPMPMLLVAAVIAADKLCEPFATSAPAPWQQTAQAARHWLVPLACAGAAFLAANYAQSGSAWTSSYAQMHPTLGIVPSTNFAVEVAGSLGGAFIRENAWLFGWPCSLCFIPFAPARVREKRALFWGLLATGVVYRVLVPKTVVASTGPIYVTELVPWLCIASVAGMQRVAARLSSLGLSDARERVAAVVVSSCLVACLTFIPIELDELQRSAAAREYVTLRLRERKATRALVFCPGLVDPSRSINWAYFAPNPWPDLRDDVIFLRVPRAQDGLRRAVQLWRERFPDRVAFTYQPARDDGELRELDP